MATIAWQAAGGEDITLKARPNLSLAFCKA